MTTLVILPSICLLALLVAIYTWRRIVFVAALTAFLASSVGTIALSAVTR